MNDAIQTEKKEYIDKQDRIIKSKKTYKSGYHAGYVLARTNQRKIFVKIINSFSSASSRATNKYEKGISAGIEMFRKYLLKELK